jgi:hypothetical protein
MVLKSLVAVVDESMLLKSDVPADVLVESICSKSLRLPAAAVSAVAACTFVFPAPPLTNWHVFCLYSTHLAGLLKSSDPVTSTTTAPPITRKYLRL